MCCSEPHIESIANEEATMAHYRIEESDIKSFNTPTRSGLDKAELLKGLDNDLYDATQRAARLRSVGRCRAFGGGIGLLALTALTENRLDEHFLRATNGDYGPMDCAKDLLTGALLAAATYGILKVGIRGVVDLAHSRKSWSFSPKQSGLEKFKRMLRE